MNRYSAGCCWVLAILASANSGCGLFKRLGAVDPASNKSPTRGFTNDAIHPGTNHGLTASVILAGYGIQRGKVVGEVYRGPKSNPGYNLSYAQPMPIDVVSGLTSINGNVVSTLAVMPTIMAIFGVSIPFQQVTEWNAVTAIIDPKRS